MWDGSEGVAGTSLATRRGGAGGGRVGGGRKRKGRSGGGQLAPARRRDIINFNNPIVGV